MGGVFKFMKEEEILRNPSITYQNDHKAGRHQLGRTSGNPPAHSKASHFKNTMQKPAIYLNRERSQQEKNNYIS